MDYRGSCHCGKVAYEVEGDIGGVVACNCSICSRKGWLLWFVDPDSFRLLTPEDETTVYTFNKHLIRHRFCRTCGVQPYAEGSDGKGNVKIAINVRCLQNVEPDAFPVQHFDGRAL